MFKKNTLLISFNLFVTCFILSQQTPPKVVVGIVVDQMCYDYLYRFQDKFSENGFKKLMKNGANCHNAQYNYVPTYTGPGHASIYTGTTPSNHGIVANDWYVRALKKEINCVDDSSMLSIATTSNDGKKSPKNLVVNTITDQLKLNNKDSKVFSISIKDRGAILPGGHLSDGSFWFDYSTGNFISSSFYMQKPPIWLEKFNAEKKVDSYLNQTWNTLLTIETYTESDADNSIYEVLLPTKKTPTFPYNFKEINKGAKDKELFTITPFANTHLTDLALNILKNEKLGQNMHPDFLAISFSTPDIVGHSFGPYSIEIEDIYLRLDLEIAKLITELETQIGKDNFLLFLTADHAVVPVPQQLIDKNLPGGYFYSKTVINELKAKLKTNYDNELILEQTNNNIYLDREFIQAKNINQNEVENFIANFMRNQKGIKRVYTSYDLQHPSSGDEWLSMVQKGYKYSESGDVIYMLESGFLSKSSESSNSHKGTSHGSAFNYDTQVPLLWYGNGIEAQNIYRKIEITDIAATLAPILRIQRPAACIGNPIIEILK